MNDKTSTPSKPPARAPTYISSSGHTLDSLPLTARLNRAADTIYNFLGLYFVSLLSLDPHAAAQNSHFNTRGPGRTPPGATAGNSTRSTGGLGSGLFGGGRLGGGGESGSSGPRGGDSGGGGGGRRMGTVDDVRGPECGSCG